MCAATVNEPTASSTLERGPSGQSGDPLLDGFRVPPHAAKPRVWWHWVNGNVTDEGVRLDLEWLRRVGIGGVTNIDAALEWGGIFALTTQVQRPLIYLSPEWRESFRRSVVLANELGLEFAIDSSPGWTVTGGPWVKPHQAMKKLVWSETRVQGGRPVERVLPLPPNTPGPFQNIPVLSLGNTTDDHSARQPYYQDVATVAYRAPVSEILSGALRPSVTTSSGELPTERLWDGDLATPISIAFPETGHAWIQFSYPEPQPVQAITAVIGAPTLGVNPLLETRESAWLEASDDGRMFYKVIDLPRSGAPQQTVAFPPVIAAVFRIVLQRPEPTAFEQLGLAKPAVAHQVRQLVLHTVARVNRFEDKAGFSTRQIVEEDDTPPIAAEDVVQRDDIIDLTDRMRPDGGLHWTPPTGHWVILRFGCSLTGHTNHPASRSGTGLEVDKLHRGHVQAYMEAYLREYERAVGVPIGGNTIQYMVTDSYEAGAQNWTDDLLEQFSRRRGYDALPWLPVLAGRVVAASRSSDRFLWDFRKTLGELISESHYAQISTALHARCMGRYGESHELGRAFIGDGMEVKKTADIPMGAAWAGRIVGMTQEDCDADIRESASVGHIYGKSVIAGESFTNFGRTYSFAPEDLKPIADRALAMGLNRFVISSSAHQPDNKPGPGMSLGPFGIWFTRKETWAEQAGGWVAYLARSSYLLQQGRFVADIAYLYGEDTNVTSLFSASSVPIPRGYSFDFINADALLHELSVKDGKLLTQSGMEYSLLALDSSTHRMSVPLLSKLRDLVRAGAVVVGSKPTQTPSLSDDEREFQAIVAELWGDGPSDRTVGLGRVFGERSLAQALAAIRVAPDVCWSQMTDGELHFVHRTLSDGELYFLSSTSPRSQAIEASFRVVGKLPELWRADTGATTGLPYRVDNDRTSVPLRLEPNDAVFIVLRRPAEAVNAIIAEIAPETLTTLAGPWDVQFPPDLGAPAHASFLELHSWTDHNDPGIKYFSGTATYHQTIQIPAAWVTQEAQVHLDLGMVKNVAEVLINGCSRGVVWKSPFALDITGSLTPGQNSIDIKVTNLWPNRLIGDKQPGARRVAYAGFDPFAANSPLLQSGLLGPVRLLRVTRSSILENPRPTGFPSGSTSAVVEGPLPGKGLTADPTRKPAATWAGEENT